MAEKHTISKIKKRRRLIVVLVFCIFCILFFFFLIRKKDYEITYKIHDFLITEAYHKDQNYYSFVLKKGDQSYFDVQLDTHFSQQKLIYDIEEFSSEDEVCIQLNSNKIRFNPLCLKNNEQISFHLISDAMKEKLSYKENVFEENVEENYSNISVSSYLYHTFYIWNYHGFYRLNQSTQEEISLFQKDIYSPNLITQVENILFIPDYETDYYFEKVYLLNMENGKVETWNLEEPIYFDSVVLGVYEDDLYLVDKHEKKEWKIDVSKRKMEQVGSESQGGITYQNGFVNVSMNKLIYQDNTFSGILPISYKLDQGLYYTYQENQMLITKEEPTSIVSYNKEWIYYLRDDSLYAYSLDYGEILLMQYFEWNFNSKNVIFVWN